ncbi:STAS/SEC14 domain-containing protein [Aquimarina litoralis]|uniref:STAS/SEC14 domain-containing protein n=1 Tax=Aquimarina litoralis TaxID=584605 RepID=UPI001C56C124|nr:STAS/SEC14 domain-containing protein [Aquimarina litoralis]MBW1296779.1 hypothetical protein [Aquimarina litoralis]
MITFYKTDFGLAEIYDDYIKVIINEGITVTPEDNNTLLEMVNNHFKNKPFVYISHRIHSYSINPIVYFETAKIKTLVGLAVVSNDPIQKSQTQIEKTFFNKEFKHFNDMDAALAWKAELLKKQD